MCEQGVGVGLLRNLKRFAPSIFARTETKPQPHGNSTRSAKQSRPLLQSTSGTNSLRLRGLGLTRKQSALSLKLAPRSFAQSTNTQIAKKFSRPALRSSTRTGSLSWRLPENFLLAALLSVLILVPFSKSGANLIPPNVESYLLALDPSDPLLDEIEAFEQEQNIDIDRALDDFKYFCTFVQTVYTDPVTEARSFKAYPSYPYLDEYTSELERAGLLAVPKCRGMLATTHPLIFSLHRSFRVWKQGGIWRCAVVRQNMRHAKELVERTRMSWARLPLPLQPPLEIDNTDKTRYAGGAELLAIPEEGETGRGDDWDLVIGDEAAQQDHLRENIRAFTPRTRTMVLPSTYNGEGDTFCDVVDGKGYPGRRVLVMPHDVHPHRVSGTPEGEAWLAIQRNKMSTTDFLIEIEMRRDVYRVSGYYSADYNPACVKPVAWDSRSILTIGMDYSYLNPASAWKYINEHDQVCWLGCELRHEVGLERYCRELFERIRDTYPQCRVRIAPDPFRGRQHHGGSDQYDEPITDIHTIRRVAKEVFGCDVLVSVNRTGRMTVKEGQHRVRRILGLRDDKRFGTIIDPACVELIQGLAGAYGPPDNATPAMLDLGTPDERRECVHVMDAARYAVCEFVTADKGLAYSRDEVTAKRSEPKKPERTIATLRASLHGKSKDKWGKIPVKG